VSSVSAPLDHFGLQKLHRSAIQDAGQVRALLGRLRDSGALLHNGMDHRNRARAARVSRVNGSRVELTGERIEPERQRELYLNFELDGSPYFFTARPVPGGSSAGLAIEMPSAIYRVERRATPRTPVAALAGAPKNVELIARGRRWRGRVLDMSYDGVGVHIARTGDLPDRTPIEIRFLDGNRAGERAWGTLRHQSRAGEVALRLGLDASQVPPSAEVSVERRDRILEGGLGRRVWRTLHLAGATARTLPGRAGFRARQASPIEVVEFPNEKGQPIKAIVDRVGEGGRAQVVVIPPAWGRTKETLLPLAATLLRTFERAGQSVTVLRLDGTQQRGEAYVDPECRRPGDEARHFTYSQVVRDLHATFRFLDGNPAFQPSSIILVTFSLAAIAGRRAVATDPTGLVSGWVSVVGMVDVQSGLRTVSGGVDYYYGALQGVEFGTHELGGVRIDIDAAARDAIENRLGCFEDARRDMAAVRVPVTWIHGRHDGWMDFSRVREMVASGDASKRRLLEVPTGHQLRNSREALQVFQLVSEEVARMALGRKLEAAAPDLRALVVRQAAERRRAPRLAVDLRRFWHDYLIGRDERLGIELLTATSAYKNFMDRQIDGLDLRRGDRILDLGSGTGDFCVRLAERDDRPSDLRVTCADLVPQALERGRRRLAALETQGLHVSHVAADLQPRGVRSAPLRPDSYDVALASLVLCYLPEPERFLREVYELLRPGGRLVISTPRRDADLSTLYVHTLMQELEPGRVVTLFGEETARQFDEIQRSYLNEAARLVTLEEAGHFQFRDAPELSRLVRRAGFTRIRTERALGDPPQVVVLTARRPPNSG
jgi:SAM-dependent methyltransferase/dienelactone hydrolase